MFIADETVNARSQVTFYRCSICVSEHVSSELVREPASFEDAGDYFDSPSTGNKRYLMI
jgi:hypothetical protein